MHTQFMSKVAKTNVVILLISVIFSFGVYTTSTDEHYYPRCQPETVCERVTEKYWGTLTVRDRGFPISYKEIQSFTPRDSSSNLSPRTYYTFEQDEFREIKIALNVLFWFALIKLIHDYSSKLKSKRHPSRKKRV